MPLGRIGAVLTVALVLTTGAMELYARGPAASATPRLGLPADVRTLVLVIHGSADEDDALLRDIVAGLAARYRDIPHAAVRFVNWAPASSQRLRAAATAEAVGTELGRTLGRVGTVRKLHLIAHSSGAYMPDAICAAYRAAGRGPVHVSMVLLDPFQIHGFVDWTHGARRHGRCADFALTVLNTDDPAPATSRPLAQACNLDITGHPDRAAFTRNGHYWPLQYYRDHLLAQEPDIGAWTHGTCPRGVVQRVPDQHVVRHPGGHARPAT